MELDLFTADSLEYELLPREADIIKYVQATVVDKSRLMVDLRPSKERTAFNQDAAPCLLTGSRIYDCARKRLLSPLAHLRLQGLFEEDFSAMAASEEQTSSLYRSLAGNSFSTSVLSAVLLGVLVAVPLHPMAKNAHAPDCAPC